MAGSRAEEKPEQGKISDHLAGKLIDWHARAKAQAQAPVSSVSKEVGPLCGESIEVNGNREPKEKKSPRTTTTTATDTTLATKQQQQQREQQQQQRQNSTLGILRQKQRAHLK